MKIKILSLLFLSSTILLADNFHNQLIIPAIDIQNPFWEFSGCLIEQKEKDSFEQLIIKWDAILNKLWTKLSDKINNDINLSIDELNCFFSDQRFIDAYLLEYRHNYSEMMDNEDQTIDPDVIAFVKRKLLHLQLHKPVKICFYEINSTLASSFGTDQNGHYLTINTSLYTPEEIKSLSDLSSIGTIKYFFDPSTSLDNSTIIEASNLYNLGITQAVSSIVHQSDFFVQLLKLCMYNKKQCSQETQDYAYTYVVFQSYLEASLQSKNPLEAARYLKPVIINFGKEFISLWQNFIEDIANCYDPDDLEAYQDLSFKERKAALYSVQDDDDEEEQ